MSHVMQGLRTARPRRARNPHPGLGNHELAILSVYIQRTQKYGDSVFADLVVITTDNPSAHAPGSVVSTGFHTSRQSPRGFEQGVEYDRLAQFVNASTGHRLDDMEKALENGIAFVEPTNPARGIRVKCRGYSKSGSTFVEYDWSTLPGQTPAAIKEVRDSLDQRYPAVAAPAPQAPPQQYAQQPAQGFHQPAYLGAPAQPAQPPPGYGPAPGAPQPWGPPPQPPSPQPTWGPPPGYQQPTAAPAAAPAPLPGSLGAILGGQR